MSTCEFFKSEIEYLAHLVSGQGISSMKQNVQAIMVLVPATNITEVHHIIGLMSYDGKFFQVFSDMVQPFIELNKKNIRFKWTRQCQKRLDYEKQVYPDLDKQYYLFTDSRQHSWSGIHIQYHEQVKGDGTIVNVPHLMTYQRGTFKGSQKNWSALTKKPINLYVFSHNVILFEGYSC